jgi:hypothetical protein
MLWVSTLRHLEPCLRSDRDVLKNVAGHVDAAGVCGRPCHTVLVSCHCGVVDTFRQSHDVNVVGEFMHLQLNTWIQEQGYARITW